MADEPICTTFIGHMAELRVRSETSYLFELYEQHGSHRYSLRGWVDIHYPCEGTHRLVIRACLDPHLVRFVSVENFGGEPDDETTMKMYQLVDEVRRFLGAEPCPSWHLDLSRRGVGTFFEQPQTYL